MIHRKNLHLCYLVWLQNISIWNAKPLLRELFHFSECGSFEVRWARTPSEKCSRTIILFEARRSNNFIVSRATGDDCLHTNRNIFVLLSSVWSAIRLARRYSRWCYCWCCSDWWNERNSFLEFFAFLTSNIYSLTNSKKAKQSYKINWHRWHAIIWTFLKRLCEMLLYECDPDPCYAFIWKLNDKFFNIKHGQNKSRGGNDKSFDDIISDNHEWMDDEWLRTPMNMIWWHHPLGHFQFWDEKLFSFPTSILLPVSVRILAIWFLCQPFERRSSC